MVKANGYGHGAAACAAAALRGGATRLAVAAAAEAEELRLHFPDVPILVMGALTVDELRTALLAARGRRGLARGLQGRLLARRSRHRPDREGPRQARQRDGQARRARPRHPDRARSRLRGRPAPGARRGLDPLRHGRRAGRRLHGRAAGAPSRPVAEAVRELAPGCTVHAANSAATLRDPATHFDMVRCGIAIYGLDPFQRDPADHGLEPALELHSYVADVKRFEPGASAGYGRTWRAPEDTWVGVLPIGYGDGVRRGLSNNAEVLVGGRRYPLVGTVSMDNVTIDLGPETDVEPGAPAVLIGAQGAERILAEEVAARLGDHQLRGHLRDLGGGCRARCSSEPLARGRARRPPPRSQPPGRRWRRRLGPTWIVGGAIRDALLGERGRGRRPGGRVRPRGGARPGDRQGRRRLGVPALGGARDLAGGLRDRRLARGRGRPARGARSRTTSAPATSPSTRSPSRWPAASRSIRPAACADADARAAPGRLGAAFEDDPLRLLRACRLAAGHELAIDPATVELARAHARSRRGSRRRAAVRGAPRDRRRAGPAARARADGRARG